MPASAALYTGAGPGTSTIGGVTPDYPDLTSAVTAVNAAPLTGGNWTFLIAGDTTETANIAMGQNTNGNTITFKPAAATTPTITFAPIADNTSGAYVANWMIGSQAINDTTQNNLI